jgi:hypothetical protein
MNLRYSPKRFRAFIVNSLVVRHKPIEPFITIEFEGDGGNHVRTGATLVTENSRDFARWKWLLVSAKKALKLYRPS